MKFVDSASTKVTADIEVPRDWFFYWFTSVDLSRVMHGHGPLPAVTGIRDQTGLMHIPGSSRMLLLSDGSTAIEQTISCDPPNEVIYRLYKLTSFFRFIVSEAQGKIYFGEIGNIGTSVEWQYTFFGRSLVSTLLLKILIPLLWKGFMQSALTESKRLAEAEIANPS